MLEQKDLVKTEHLNSERIDVKPKLFFSRNIEKIIKRYEVHHRKGEVAFAELRKCVF